MTIFDVALLLKSSSPRRGKLGLSPGARSDPRVILDASTAGDRLRATHNVSPPNDSSIDTNGAALGRDGSGDGDAGQVCDPTATVSVKVEGSGAKSSRVLPQAAHQNSIDNASVHFTELYSSLWSVGVAVARR